MAKFRKRPVVVDAEQWFPGVKIEGVVTSGQQGFPPWIEIEGGRIPMPDHWGWIITKEGGIGVTPGDWVITGVKGERYPCKPDIFEMTYEPVGKAT